MPLTRVLLCCALACAFSAQAQEDDGPMPDPSGAAQTDAYSLRLSAQLAARGGARNLALAALLRDVGAARVAAGNTPDGDAPSQAMPEDAQAAAWRRSATTARDRDAITDLLLLGANGAVRRDAATRWGKAEPDNAAPLFFQGLPVDDLLAAIRSRQRFDLHYLDEMRWLIGVYAANLPNDAEIAAMFDGDEAFSRDAFVANAAGGLWSTVAIPGFDDLVRACRNDALRATPTRAADCAHAADVLSGASDTAIGRGIGNVLRNGIASDDASRAAAREASRRAAWQLVQWSQAARGQPDGGAPQFLRLVRDPSVHTEIDLIGRVLTEANVPLDPPSGWEPPRPPQRQR